MARTESGSELAERLIANYALEADIYLLLLALAREQGELLGTSGDIDRCTALFDRKDELIRSLARVEREVEPLKRRWRTETVEPASRQRLNGLLDAILNTIEDIMDQEQRNEQLLLECQREAEASLGRLQNGARLPHVQADDDPSMPRFADVPH
jgi:flagellar biosynthesis/type III secretory pathway chaperone